MVDVVNSSTKLPGVLIIEGDARMRQALNAELEEDYAGIFYGTLSEAMTAHDQGELPSRFHAAIVQMVTNSKDELGRLTHFFNQFPDVPVFLTLSYNCDFQLQETYIRSWTEHIFFRPFDIDKLINSLKALEPY